MPRACATFARVEALLAFVAAWGYPLLLAVGFAEFAGLPVAAVPVVIAAGALSAGGSLHPAGVVASVVAGSLVADAGWYALARRSGAALVGYACALTPSPSGCVYAVEARVERMGARYVLGAKLLPGAANLVAPAAGLARMRAPRFLAADAAALALWAALLTGLGYAFHREVELALRWATRSLRLLLAALAGLLVVALAGRAAKMLHHRRAHEPAEG